jgi:hypothetical protein
MDYIVQKVYDLNTTHNIDIIDENYDSLVLKKVLKD